MDFVNYLDDNFGVRTVAGGKQIQLASGPCPFCGEDRRDLRVYYDPTCTDIGAKKGYCHHCSHGFSAVEFVAAYEGCSYKQAIAILSGAEDSFKRSETASEGQTESGVVWPQLEPISSSTEAMGYCEQRGLTEEVVERQGIYFSPHHTMLPNGRTMWSGNRVVFVIYDPDGNPVSWQGRDITGKSKQKYLFPVGFKKAEYLYNCQNIKYRPEYLILTEGAMSSIGWIKAGFEFSIGTFGKSISDHQRRMLVNVAPKVLYIAWDTDAHWNKYELVEDISHLFSDIRIIDLQGKDADEMTKEQLITAFDAAKNYSWSDKILGML